ncbi:MAG: hypothetical protein IE909_01620 [Campylobacterales bacterium]|nr:hypothetical protein [Campylobacterales bacterium]
MDIYIYGSEPYKKKVHDALNLGNIRFKIDDGEIIDVSYLDDLKDLIQNKGDQIFLIDQSKVIEDDFVKKYLKFLIPKDGIEKKFLDKHGLGDISLREYSDLCLYIERRMEYLRTAKPKAEDIKSLEEMFDNYL